MGRTGITLTRFIIETQAGYPAATGEFSALLAQIGLAGKLIAHDLRRAGLINILGTTGGTNVQGEARRFKRSLAECSHVKRARPAYDVFISNELHILDRNHPSGH